MMHLIRVSFIVILTTLSAFSNAQQITGIWSGKMNKKRAEIKFIQKGDSITGTSYYYESGENYLRYSIKGYFDASNNSVVWWDDQLISDEGKSAKEVALLSVADFNCPGDGKMMLDGTTTQKESRINSGGLFLTKIISTSFPDEWDFIIDNYLYGTNDPDLIDSVGLVAFTLKKKSKVTEQPKESSNSVITNAVIPQPDPEVVLVEHKKKMEENFTIRKKVFVSEIPVQGDSIELRFFDNVQVDGDSITLFLNEKLIFTHIRLTEKPFIVKLSLKELNDTNELTMVAENLGAIPPNTAYMVAIVGDKRYEVNLSSTEETSGMIKLSKPH
ncbi:MAG TPA: hypothetical protein VNT20_12020 [Flavisolibacter sp.]|nr:hypothetical protein [Flavisolibacter sp.]